MSGQQSGHNLREIASDVSLHPSNIAPGPKKRAGQEPTGRKRSQQCLAVVSRWAGEELEGAEGVVLLEAAGIAVVEVRQRRRRIDQELAAHPLPPPMPLVSGAACVVGKDRGRDRVLQVVAEGAEEKGEALGI